MSTEPFKGWETKSSTGKRFDFLDGLRGVAILLVVAFHTFYTNPAGGKAMRAIGFLLSSGRFGVPVFFVLSGFLISYPFFRARERDRQSWCPEGYARRRVAKILPPYYLSIAIFTVYYVWRFADLSYVDTALSWALGLPNFIPTPLRFNASYWSLIVEIHFYIVLPLLFFIVRGLDVRRAARVLFLILFLIPLIVRQMTWPTPGSGNESLTSFLMGRFPCQLDFFSWGILFAGIFVSFSAQHARHRALAAFGYVGGGLFLACLVLWASLSSYFQIDRELHRWSVEIFHFLPGFSAFLLLFLAFDPLCAASRLLSYPALRFIGLVSYEWFLFHQPVVYLFRDSLEDAHGSLGMYLVKTLLPLGLTFGLAVLVYRYFSFPLMIRIRAGKVRRN